MPFAHDPAVLLPIIGLTAGVGLASAAVATVFVSLPEPLRRWLVPHLVSFATGALLGAALIGLIPGAIEGAGLDHVHEVGLAVLAGLLLFFVLEKLVLWRHCHEDECEAHVPGDAHAPSDHHRSRAVGAMILWGDAAHNVLDGVVIAAAYLTRPGLGVATAIAVFAHELPQEVGDIAILLHSGMSRLRALSLNLLISVSAVAGGIAAYWSMADALRVLPYALAFAGASLLYVAVADLIPGLHRHVDPKRSVQQFVLILAGLATIWLTQHHEGVAAAAGMP
jgi:zinc and cadmium transporter